MQDLTPFHLMVDERTVKHGVFISYRRADSFFAARLRDRLETAFPGRVFIDVAGIDPGSDFVARLDTVLDSCPVLVAVIGKDWLTSSDGSTRLGEADDFVTYEISAALRRNAVVIPVLIEDTPFPETNVLPEALQALRRRNAMSVSHARFETDVQYLIDAMYAPLGLRPKTRLEKVLESIGTGQRFDERTRDWLAIGSTVAGAAGLLYGALWIWLDGLSGGSEDLVTGMGISLLGLLLGVLGLNSARRRKLALLGIGLAAATTVTTVAAAVMSGLFVTADPWVESWALAAFNSRAKTLPADQIRWSRRVPFGGPKPTTVCTCLKRIVEPTGDPPFARDARSTFENGCSGIVIFWAVRATRPGVAEPLLWGERLGQEHALVTLVPGQTVHLPMGGMYAQAAFPWRCENQ